MPEESDKNHLYVGRKSNGQIGYVGIGGQTRPFEGHTEEADDVLRGGEIWITATPFSTRQDAEMAESLLIRALTWAAENPPDLANVSKVTSSKHLVPALPYKAGILRYSSVSRALFVKVRPSSLKGRSAPSGEAGQIELAMRCNRWWRLMAAKDRNDQVELLIAVSSQTKPSRVIGVWRTRPVSDWWYEDQARPEMSEERAEPWNSAAPVYGTDAAKGWVVTLESLDSNVNDWQGLEFDWETYAPQGIGFSRDIRPAK